MERPTISNNDALRQASATADVYLQAAIESVDRHLGADHRDPALLAALIAAQVSDFNNCSTMAALYELADAVLAQGVSHG